MSIQRGINVRIVLVISVAFLSCAEESETHYQINGGDRRGLGETPGFTVKVFDVTSHGAAGDDKTDNTMAFMQTWVKACKNSSEQAKFLVPEGSFVTAPVVFQGPCLHHMIVEVKGTIKATTDLSEYSEDSWFLFDNINGLTLTGGGTFDGQGEAVWKYNDCRKNKNCVRLPSSIKFQKVNNSIIDGINSLNSKYFHMHVTSCSNYTAINLNITAPANSPNTDGMHISDTTDVKVSDCKIQTGDDCISIGQGVTNAYISNILCGPGHGISVGSLGKYPDEKDVNRIFVTNCSLSNTTNGARIKTWAASPPSKASNITFQDITMESVKNPIIIDQKYGSRKSNKPSNVEVTDLHFKNIKGTTVSNVAVSFSCSSSFPCKEIELFDIDLTLNIPRAKNSSIVSECLNAEIKSGGTQNPSPCQ